MITQEQLKEILMYDHESGIFTWVKGIGLRGRIAGSVQGNGYLYIKINGKRYLAHRLAWLATKGEFPKHGIDHKNGNPLDNRIFNLREATQSENGQNQKISTKNTSGFMGVWFCKEKNKWAASIAANKKRKHLGYYKTAEQASNAYVRAKAVLHTFQPTIRVYGGRTETVSGAEE